MATTVIGVDQAVRVLQHMPFDKRLTATPIMVSKGNVDKYDLSGELPDRLEAGVFGRVGPAGQNPSCSASGGLWGRSHSPASGRDGVRISFRRRARISMSHVGSKSSPADRKAFDRLRRSARRSASTKSPREPKPDIRTSGSRRSSGASSAIAMTGPRWWRTSPARSARISCRACGRRERTSIRSSWRAPLHTSRTPTREGLLLLEKEGLCLKSLRVADRASSRRPCRISPSFTRFRATIMTVIAGDAARKVSAEGLERLRATANKLREALGEPESYFWAGVEFHERIAEVSSNLDHAAISRFADPEDAAPSAPQHPPARPNGSLARRSPAFVSRHRRGRCGPRGEALVRSNLAGAFRAVEPLLRKELEAGLLM